jgi:hypothetical protein
MLLLKAGLKRSSFDPRTRSDIPLLNNKLYFDEVELVELVELDELDELDELVEHKYRLYHHVVTGVYIHKTYTDVTCIGWLFH